MELTDQRVNGLSETLNMDSPPKIVLNACIDLPEQVDGLEIPPELGRMAPHIYTDDKEQNAGWVRMEAAPLRFDMRCGCGWSHMARRTR